MSRLDSPHGIRPGVPGCTALCRDAHIGRAAQSSPGTSPRPRVAVARSPKTGTAGAVQDPPGCLHCPVRLTTPLNGYVPMSVIWVSCHMGANAVKALDLEIGALGYGCCVPECGHCVNCRDYVKV
ncbi:hypothetical protein JCM4914_48620 [Streptomyces platensis subsp. malvinus]